jgi:hypothetical protein
MYAGLGRGVDDSSWVRRPRRPVVDAERAAIGTADDRWRGARFTQRRTFAELLIDCEEDRTLRAVLVGMLRESS